MTLTAERTVKARMILEKEGILRTKLYAEREVLIEKKM